MDYKEFICVIESEVRQKVGKEVIVQRYEATKNNGMKRIGLVLRRNDITMSPTIYLEEFYTQYQCGIPLSELVDSIHDLYQHVSMQTSYPYEDVLDYQKIKGKIAYKLIHEEMNLEFLKDVPFDNILDDLVIVPYVLFDSKEYGTATLQIKNEHLRSWGIDETEVILRSIKNTPELLPAEMGQLTEYMYVLTNSSKNFGASVIFYPDALDNAYRNLKENFYILPSSVHEVILIPESFGVNAEHLKSIVKEINDTEVKREEVLSNSVYYFIGNESRIVTC